SDYRPCPTAPFMEPPRGATLCFTICSACPLEWWPSRASDLGKNAIGQQARILWSEVQYAWKRAVRDYRSASRLSRATGGKMLYWRSWPPWNGNSKIGRIILPVRMFELFAPSGEFMDGGLVIGRELGRSGGKRR